MTPGSASGLSSTIKHRFGGELALEQHPEEGREGDTDARHPEEVLDDKRPDLKQARSLIRRRRRSTLGMLSPADYENRTLGHGGTGLAASRLASTHKIKFTAPTPSGAA